MYNWSAALHPSTNLFDDNRRESTNNWCHICAWNRPHIRYLMPGMQKNRQQLCVHLFSRIKWISMWLVVIFIHYNHRTFSGATGESLAQERRNLLRGGNLYSLGRKASHSQYDIFCIYRMCEHRRYRMSYTGQFVSFLQPGIVKAIHSYLSNPVSSGRRN